MKNKLHLIFLMTLSLLVAISHGNVGRLRLYISHTAAATQEPKYEDISISNTNNLNNIPKRRDDDYKVLGDSQPQEVTNDDDRDSDTGTTVETMYFGRTEFPITTPENSEKIDIDLQNEIKSGGGGTDGGDEGKGAPDNFAVFGLTYRPVFPLEDDSPPTRSNSSSSSNNNGTETETALYSESSLPNIHNVPDVGGVDIHLAQLASVNVFSSNASKVDVYVSKNGLNCTCGLSTPDTQRIVNGMPVKINELPWTVALFKKNWIGFYGSKPYCGGSLINSRYILTASHCVDGMTAKSLKVRLNEEDLVKPNENENGYFEIQVEEITMHPKYNRRTIDNDVALLKLATPVEFGMPDGVVRPVCLPASTNNDLETYIGTVAGWGAVSQGGSLSQVLRKVEVPIISNHDCNTKSSYNGKITDNMLCAGYLETGGKDSCQGDSGGPLIIDNAGRRTLVGVVSWGYGCARPKSPGVYARVSRYGEWILANTKDGQWCQD